MSFDLTKNMPQSIKANFNEAESRLEALEALSILLSSDIINDLTTGGTDKVLSAEQGVELKGMIDGINVILQSDDLNLDTVQEIIDAIKAVETSLDTILVNDLTTGGTAKALTAQQGVVLKDLIDDLAALVDDLTTDSIVEGSSNLYFTNARAKSAAVVNDMSGSQNDQAGSVSSVKSYIASQISSTTRKYVKKTTTGSIAASEEKIFVNITAADITLTLPSVGSSEDGESHLVMNKTTSTKNVTVVPSDSDTIDGGSSLVLLPGEYLEFIYEHSATNWFLKD